MLRYRKSQLSDSYVIDRGFETFKSPIMRVVDNRLRAISYWLARYELKPDPYYHELIAFLSSDLEKQLQVEDGDWARKILDTVKNKPLTNGIRIGDVYKIAEIERPHDSFSWALSSSRFEASNPTSPIVAPQRKHLSFEDLLR